MKVTVLSDNLSINSLQSEWGLSFYIEYQGFRILYDVGGSDIFLSNAKALGIDISEVDFAVLSHAHYDHSSGMPAFFNANSKASFFVSPNAGENCYSGNILKRHYIGLPKGLLHEYSSRIIAPEGVAEVAEGIFIVPHSAPGLDAVGRKSRMYIKRGRRYVADDFSHEQSLVFRTDDGLVVFNSCSHSGADIIADEISHAFPDEKIFAYFGGLHLFKLNDREITDISGKVKSSGLKHLYTGHCTGERAFRLLKNLMDIDIRLFHCGMTVDTETIQDL